MRSDVVLMSLLVATMPASGRPLAVPKPMPESHVFLDLHNLHLHLFHDQNAPADASSARSVADANWSQEKSLSNLSVGPLRAHFGVDDNPRAGLSSYGMQGTDQLGSSLWHNVQGRSAKLLFVWPTDK